MLALEVLGGAVVLVGLALVLGRRLPTFDDEPDDAPDSGLPEGRPLCADDIPRLRFRIAVRGYRMADVDAALEAARLALAAHDVEEPVLADQPTDATNLPVSDLEARQARPKRRKPAADETS